MDRSGLSLLFLIAVGALVCSSAVARPDPGGDDRTAAYADTLQSIELRRDALRVDYLAATSDSASAAVLELAQREIARAVVDAIIPFWFGTRWDFNGVSETPGQGTIACGYFVTTVLRDAGLEIERVKLAQQASETIILSLVGEDQVRRFSSVPLSEFLDRVRKFGHGLYVIGLDYHVGFLACDEREIRFIHSSFLAPLCVIDENAEDSRVLSSSAYRVIGKLSGDQQLIIKWLTGTSIPTKSG